MVDENKQGESSTTQALASSQAEALREINLSRYGSVLAHANRFAERKDYVNAVIYYKLGLEKLQPLLPQPCGKPYYYKPGEPEIQNYYYRINYYLGLCYEHGLGVQKDEAQAVHYYRNAADDGHSGFVFALYAIAVCSYKGIGMQVNEKEAFDYFKQAIESSPVFFLNPSLGKEISLLFDIKPPTSREICANSFYWLGECYKYGRGVEANESRAIDCYSFAVKYESLEAKKALQPYAGRMAEDSTKTARFQNAMALKDNDKVDALILLLNEDEVITPFRPSVFKNTALEQFEADLSGVQLRELANQYASGEGKDKNKRKAAQLYELAANKGDIKAHYHLGVCYTRGIYFNEDVSLAIEKWKSVAQLGCIEAAHALAEIYFRRGENLVEAQVWFDRAVQMRIYQGKSKQDDENLLPSQEALAKDGRMSGYFYFTRKAEKKDMVVARQHYLVAAALGAPTYYYAEAANLLVQPLEAGQEKGEEAKLDGIIVQANADSQSRVSVASSLATPGVHLLSAIGSGLEAQTQLTPVDEILLGNFDAPH